MSATNDFYEIDFLGVESPKSGDAIPLRYQINGFYQIHVVDGGFQATGEKVAAHIKTHYGNPGYIHRVVVTHPDGDHAGGLRTVLKEFQVGELWMLRPWLYADELIARFARFTSVENLKRRLKEIYPNIAALEEIAQERGIDIREPFQGGQIGAFTVMAPTRARYLDLIVDSERTPESVEDAQKSVLSSVGSYVERAAAKVVSFLKSAWGEEVFSTEETSAENEMSVIQVARLCGQTIVLTGDAGRGALWEAADYAPTINLSLPGVDRFQVPHHGSRRNVSTETLDRWLGARLPSKPSRGEEKFIAIISSAKEDEDHPRKSVVRALWHRGAYVVATEGQDILASYNSPGRGWGAVAPLDYPEDQEA